MAELTLPEIVKQTCDLLKEDGLPVYYDERTSTCTVRKGGGIDITATTTDIIIKNRDRDTIFLFPEPKGVEHAHDLFHSEDVVRIKGRLGDLELRTSVVGKKTLRVMVVFDVDKDSKMDAGAVRLWK